MPHPTPVKIAGVGLVTPLSPSAWGTFRALLEGRRLTDRAKRPENLPDDVGPVDLVRTIGAVSIAQHAAADPAIELAERAILDAAANAGWTPAQLQGLPCVIGASKGAVHAWSTAAEHRGMGRFALAASHPAGATPSLRPAPGEEGFGRPPAPPPADMDLAVALGPHGYLAHHLRQRLKLGRTSCRVSACASGLDALDAARRMLLHPTASEQGVNAVVVVSAEASLLPMFVHSYRRLGVLPPLTPTRYEGRPLHPERNGFVLAEQAAAVILMREDAPSTTPSDATTSEPPRPHAASQNIQLLDTAVRADAYDLIRSDPNHPALRHIAKRLLRGRSIDLIHPHATGTAEHDGKELAALSSALHEVQQETASGAPSSAAGAMACDLYACKGAVGHGLGCSGLTSLVIAALCGRTRRRPPMPWLASVAPEDATAINTAAPGLLPRAEAANALPKSSTHAVFAAGFGGHVAGALLRVGD